MNSSIDPSSLTIIDSPFQLDFLVLGFQRTGTTGLMKALCESSDIASIPLEISLPWFFSRQKGPFKIRHDSTLHKQLVQAALSAGYFSNEQGKRCGAKTAFGSSDELKDSIELLQAWAPSLKIIAIMRHDLLATAASLLRAQQTDQWQVWDDQQCVKAAAPIHVPLSFVKYLRCEQIRFEHLLNSCCLDLIWVDYESEFKDFPSLIKRCCNYLQISPPESIENHGKVSPLAETFVTNYSSAREFADQLAAQTTLESVNSILPPKNLLTSVAARGKRVFESCFLPASAWK